MTDQLPPWDEKAEQAVLGCCLGGPFAEMEKIPDAIRACAEQFGTDDVFYDLRHQSIWHCLTHLRTTSTNVDTITVANELKSRGMLEQITLAYVSSLPETAMTLVNLPDYIAVVWEKFIARQLLASVTTTASTVLETGGLTESFIANIDERHARWKGLLERGAITPKNLCAPADFADGYYNCWFVREQEKYGLALPFEFPMRIRPHELTLFTGDNGSGKSSMLGLITICCGLQYTGDEKICIASMEVPPEVTLWIMARQMLGVGKLERTPANELLAADALAWLQKKVFLYNFLGITDWRELLACFKYAWANCGAKIFIVDSVMRIGIPDDDYALQGLVACAFADFAVKTGAHVFLVVHENKGDGSAKNKVRGSKQWTDNAFNVVGTKRNEAKDEKMEELKAELKASRNASVEKRAEAQKTFDAAIYKLKDTWDAKFILSKQRWPGSQQNASRWLYFDRASLQFHEQPDMGNINYLL